MSERAIMFLVIVALLAAAFFFPYENNDGYVPGSAAMRQPADDKKDPGPGAVAGAAGPLALPDAVSLDGGPLGGQTFGGDPGLGGGTGGALGSLTGTGGWMPAAGNVSAARQAEANAIAARLETRKGGFGEGVRLEGTYVCQLPDVPDTDPPAITFHRDGTFADRRFLSARFRAVRDASTQPSATPMARPDCTGTYDIHGFTLELIPADGGTATPHTQVTISPVGDDEDLARPQKLYIEGKILRIKRN